MNLHQRITQVRTMRSELDAALESAPPSEWARADARLREIERDLAELIDLAQSVAQQFEKPEVWTRDLDAE